MLMDSSGAEIGPSVHIAVYVGVYDAVDGGVLIGPGEALDDVGVYGDGVGRGTAAVIGGEPEVTGGEGVHI